MGDLQIDKNPSVSEKFDTYPVEIRPKLEFLRKLIIETASEFEEISRVEETLKWGEPSYLVKKGSTIRIDWKARSPEQYAIYFKCTSLLVPSFKSVYGKTFSYEKNRAIVFHIEDQIPVEALKQCLGAALRYHKVKGIKDCGLKAGD